MKTPETTDPFQTECWCLEKATDPYRVFVLCFTNAGDLDALRKLLLHIFLFIHPFEHQNEKRVYDVFIAFMAIYSVVEAAHYLCNEDEEQKTGKSTTPKNPYKNDLPAEEQSFTSHFITPEEYLNPLKVLRAFFKYQPREDWRTNIHEILYYCITKASIQVEMDLFSLWFYLTKLLEAAHIIAKNKIGGGAFY